jgi:hypothetical protein
MQRDNGVAPIIRAAQNQRELGALHVAADLSHLCGSLVQGLLALLLFGNIEKETRFFKVGALLLPRIDDFREGRLLAQNALSLLAVVPKFRL